MYSALTRNLGYRTASATWLEGVLSASPAPDLVFVQEVTPGFLAQEAPGFTLLSGVPGDRACEGRVSAVLTASAIEIFDDSGTDAVGVDGGWPFASLGTYVARQRVTLGDRPWTVLSVHTSPSPVATEKRREEFQTRGPCESRPYWTDAFLAELRAFMAKNEDPVLLAGDFNQALALDKASNHSCAKAFFDVMRDLGFVDVTNRDWKTERATQWPNGYQCDRVFVSGAGADLVRMSDPEVEPVDDKVSDHAPLRFTIEA